MKADDRGVRSSGEVVAEARVDTNGILRVRGAMAGRFEAHLDRGAIPAYGEKIMSPLLAPYTKRYFEVLAEVWDSRSHEMAQQIAVGLYPAVQAPATPSTTRTPG